MSYLLKAQSDCEDVNKELNLQIISKVFTNLPSDSAIQALEEKYFPLNSLTLCLYFLQADITDGPQTSLLYKRVTDIAEQYIKSDTFLLLTAYDNSGRVTDIFNNYATKYHVRYVSMGTKLLPIEVSYAIGLFNQHMEQHLLERNGKDWRKNFKAELEGYYNEQLEKMSRKEKAKKKNNY
jgi:hypothetical protein